ncbi:MAG: transglutaminaseTgpA domain-containing protein, partial [Dehalococcoidia bacterium]|nr:transglutaminaseTgpA domain-containing protein [Dehalococcoidia bacterium]
MSDKKYSAFSRLFAFLAVSFCAAAVAWISNDLVLFITGVLGLACGHLFSWRRRDRLSRLFTALMVLLMVILTIFLGSDMLVQGFGDRLLLSRYLVYGSVLGSFDLGKRRNVLASLVLGGLLLVLISEFALNLWFFVFLLAFVFFSLLSVIMDRLSGEATQIVISEKIPGFTAVRLISGFISFALLVSLVFFFLMPRFTARQVAQASWLPSRIDLGVRGLFNLPGRPGASISAGILPSLDDAPLAGDGQRVTLGYTGPFSDKAVMYVRSRISSYWRGLTMDTYDGRGWLSQGTGTTLIDENRQEFVLPDSVSETPGQGTYWQTYYLLSD